MLDLIIPHNFIARDYQIPFLHEIDKAIRGDSKKRFFYIIWHRRSGKDKSCIADVAPRRLIKDPCLVKYIYPTSVMGRENLWDGIDGNGFRYMNHIPDKLRDGVPNGTSMKVRVKNGTDTPSMFQISGANHPDSLRGGNPKMYIFSEWADHDPYAWDVVEPVLRENNGIAVFNTTPKGDNHARSLYEFAKNNPLWWVQTLTYKDTGVFSEDQYKHIVEDTVNRFETDGRSSEEAIAYCEQEYMCSFDSPVIGSYYGQAIKRAEAEGRIGNVPYDNSLPVHTAWDLGMDDSMSIWFFQECGMEKRFMDFYESSGEGLAHYIQVLQERKYIYGRHIAPHDISVRELGTGKSRLEVAKSLGVNFTVAPRMDIDDGINMARTVFSQCWFDALKCNRGLMALRNYKKDWDEKNKVFRKTALHNWASHGADAFRTFAIGDRKASQFKQSFNTGGIRPYYEGLPG